MLLLVGARKRERERRRKKKKRNGKEAGKGEENL
jgi:hypothetical protein